MTISNKHRVPTTTKFFYLRDPENQGRVLTVARKFGKKGKKLHYGIAVCKPTVKCQCGHGIYTVSTGDTFSKEIGRKVAIGRMEKTPGKVAVKPGEAPLITVLKAIVQDKDSIPQCVRSMVKDELEYLTAEQDEQDENEEDVSAYAAERTYMAEGLPLAGVANELERVFGGGKTNPKTTQQFRDAIMKRASDRRAKKEEGEPHQNKLVAHKTRHTDTNGSSLSREERRSVYDHLRKHVEANLPKAEAALLEEDRGAGQLLSFATTTGRLCD